MPASAGSGIHPSVLKPVVFASGTAARLDPRTGGAARGRVCTPARSSQPRGSKQSQLAGPRDRVGARGDVELAKDALHVGLDGVERDVERLADLPLREVGREQAEHGKFPLAEILL